MMRAARAFRALPAGLVLAAALAVGPAADQIDPDVTAATETVLRQLDAFRRGDFEAAYAFASALIHQLFDRPAFERMVRDGYPEIAHSLSAVVIESVATPNGSVFLRLRILGANGNRVEALYELVPEDGRFRVNGVVSKRDATESA
jgi:hypothetical protein